MSEPTEKPGAREAVADEMEQREEAAVAPLEPMPDEEPASKRGEADPDNPTGAP